MDNVDFSRNISLNERLAYQNLEEYDRGNYRPSALKKNQKNLEYKNFVREKNLNLDTDLLKDYLHYGKVLNSKHSNFLPGVFAEKNSYEASFSKKCYYNSELEFIIELFISHHNIHAFEDGNKRTALNFF